MLILILGRALQGLFSGAIQGLVFVLLSDVVSLRERGKYQAILGAITGGSSIVAPMIGGLITDSRWGWRGCFWLNVPLGVCAIGGYLLFLKTGPPEAKSLREMLGRVDWFGALLCVVGITLFLLGLTWAVKLGWGAAQVLGPLLSGLAVMALFVIWEWKGAKEPSVPITLFANRNYAICAGTMFFLGYGLNGAGYYIPLLYQLAFGNTPSQSGLKTIPWMGAHIPSSMTAGILSSRFGVYVFFPKVGMALASIAFGVMSTWDLGTGVGLQVGSLVMLGVGFGISLSMLLLAVQANLEKGTIGPGTTTAAFLRTIGGTVGIGVGGTIMQASVAAALSPDRLSALALSSNVSTTDLQLAVENTLNKLPSPSVPQPAIDAATHAVQEAYVSAITRVFLAAAPVVALGWILVVWLKHVPLRGKEAKEVSRVELDEQGKQGDPKV